MDSRSDDLLVVLERDVAADHVVEQDSEGPDGGRDCLVLTPTDPLRRTVDARSCIHQQSAFVDLKYNELFIRTVHRPNQTLYIRRFFLIILILIVLLL